MSLWGNLVGAFVPTEQFEKSIEANAKAAKEAQDTADQARKDAESAQKTANDALPKAGGDMTGNINMGDKKVTGLGEPTDGKDAVNKKYVDDKRTLFTVILPANGWIGDSAPFKQTIAVEGIQSEDRPHYGLVYSDDTETALAEKEAWALVDDLDTADGSVTFTCFEDKPEVSVTVQMEVHR